MHVVTMDLKQAYFTLKFQNAMLEAKAEAFQGLFQRLMELAHGNDFMPCRPWGVAGDRKNDGYLKSERRLFQVYAPNEMVAKKAIAKIEGDFLGALQHWQMYFDKWTFVHNAFSGLPPHVIQLLLDLESQHKQIKFEPWSKPDLLNIFNRLSQADLESWFGYAPAEASLVRLGFEDLETVLRGIAAKPAPLPSVVREVPMGKIEANALSESTATLLKAGMTKAPLVEDFFRRWNDRELGERIAAAFGAEYNRVKNNRAPDQVFSQLQDWASGGSGSPEHQVAVLAVLAYFFESCDIFEPSRSDQ